MCYIVGEKKVFPNHRRVACTIEVKTVSPGQSSRRRRQVVNNVNNVHGAHPLYYTRLHGSVSASK